MEKFCISDGCGLDKIENVKLDWFKKDMIDNFFQTSKIIIC